MPCTSPLCPPAEEQRAGADRRRAGGRRDQPLVLGRPDLVAVIDGLVVEDAVRAVVFGRVHGMEEVVRLVGVARLVAHLALVAGLAQIPVAEAGEKLVT